MLTQKKWEWAAAVFVAIMLTFMWSPVVAAEFTADIREHIFNHDVTGKLYVKDTR